MGYTDYGKQKMLGMKLLKAIFLHKKEAEKFKWKDGKGVAVFFK